MGTNIKGNENYWNETFLLKAKNNSWKHNLEYLFI
jgi:hypothetical protein